jgi:hypothetical protein
MTLTNREQPGGKKVCWGCTYDTGFGHAPDCFCWCHGDINITCGGKLVTDPKTIERIRGPRPTNKGTP